MCIYIYTHTLRNKLNKLNKLFLGDQKEQHDDDFSDGPASHGEGTTPRSGRWRPGEDLLAWCCCWVAYKMVPHS